MPVEDAGVLGHSCFVGKHPLLLPLVLALPWMMLPIPYGVEQGRAHLSTAPPARSSVGLWVQHPQEEAHHTSSPPAAGCRPPCVVLLHGQQMLNSAKMASAHLPPLV